MAEEERNKKNNELKIKKKDYKGYDDEEFGDGQSGGYASSGMSDSEVYQICDRL